METIKLKHFCSVVETGSLSRAAKLLGITHPGIHKSIKSLELDFEVQLTVPDGRGIRITNEGMNFYERAKEILAKVDNLYNSVRANQSSVIRVGFSELFSSTLPLALVKKFKGQKNFSFHERCPGDCEPQIASGSLDYGIVDFPISHTGVNHTFISDFKISLYSAKKENFSEEMRFIVPNSLYQSKQRDHWDERIFSRKKIVKTNMLSIGIDLALNGNGVIYIPEFIAKKINNEGNPKKKLYKVNSEQNFDRVMPFFLISRFEKKNDPLKSRLINCIKKELCT